MKRGAATIVGLAILAIAATFVGRMFLSPARERVEQRSSVLSGAYEERLTECRILEDAELPADVERPGVGEAIYYLHLAVLYPGVANLPAEPEEHRLVGINGSPTAELSPVHAESAFDDEGTTVYLIFKTDGTFDFARLVRPDKTVLEKVALE
jgi:hypothetical protein